MLKELEKKIIANKLVEEEIPDIAVVPFMSEDYGEILVQNFIPMEDFDMMFQRCKEDLTEDLILNHDSSIVVYKNVLKEYTNVDCENMSEKDIQELYDDIYYNKWMYVGVAEKLDTALYQYCQNKRLEIIFARTLETFFSDQVTRNALEQIQEDLESLDTEKIADLFKLFGVSNGVK
jgi:hypothetical protein